MAEHGKLEVVWEQLSLVGKPETRILSRVGLSLQATVHDEQTARETIEKIEQAAAAVGIQLGRMAATFTKEVDL